MLHVERRTVTRCRRRTPWLRDRGVVGRTRGRRVLRDVRDDDQEPGSAQGEMGPDIRPGGSYTVAVNGQAVARGKYTSTAKTITLDREQGSGCTGAGTYAWKRSGKTVSFTKKRESASCQARAVVLAHRFTQVR